LDKKARFVAFFSVAVVVVVDGTMAKKKETRLGLERKKEERKEKREEGEKKEGRSRNFPPVQRHHKFRFQLF